MPGEDDIAGLARGRGARLVPGALLQVFPAYSFHDDVPVVLAEPWDGQNGNRIAETV
jgi:hypothetical protein